MVKTLSLQNIRCPLALILLKKSLLALSSTDSLIVFFDHVESMNDIKRYLDQKNYCYRCNDNRSLEVICIK